MSRTAPQIVAVGASAAVGRTALQVTTSARARKLVPHARPLLDKRGQHVGVAAAGGLPDGLHGYERLVALATQALAEACAGLAGGPFALLVALPEAGRPDDDPRFSSDFLADLEAAARVPIDQERSQVVRAGHAGGALTLEAALSLLAAGPATVIVGGVDSYYDPRVLAWIDEACRLHALGAEDGFIPAEGAAFLVLSRGDAPAPPAGAPLATVARVVTGRERTVAEGEPNLADAMTGLLGSLVEARGGAPLPWVLTDLNGERHRGLEWAKVAARGLLASGAAAQHLPDDLGDVGAASGALIAAIACTSFRIGCAPARSAAVALHAEGEARGAFLLEAPPAADAEADAAAQASRAALADAPARDQAAASRDAVERALLGLHTLPARVGRGPIVEAAEAALGALERLEASDVDDADHLDRLDAAVARVGTVAALLGAIDAPRAVASVRELEGEERALRACRERTVDAIVAQQDRLLRAAPAAPLPAARATRFRASVGLPNLHAFARDPVAPQIAVAPPEDDLTALSEEAAAGGAEGAGEAAADEGDAEAPEPAAPEPAPERLEDAPPGPEKPLLERLARDCIEEISVLGGLRESEGDERWAWHSAAGFEQRLLDNLDALVALSPRPLPGGGASPGVDVAAALQRHVADAPTVDPHRPYARAFVLGAMEGEDAVRAAVLALRQSHPAARASQRGALALAPSPAVAPAMQRLAAGEDPALAALALDVLRLRREATVAAALPCLTHPDIALRESAARCLGVAPEREAAVQLLERLAEAEDEDRVAAAAAEALLLQGASAGLHLARRSLQEERELPGSLGAEARRRLLRLLALAGDTSDAGLLSGLLRGDPREAEALGWFGDPAHLEPLLATLERCGPAAGAAPGPYEAAINDALRRILGGTPDGGGLDGLEDPLRPLPGVSAWLAFWEERRGSVAASRKHRFGALYTPRLTLEELERDGVRARDREVAELELSLLTKGASRFWAGDWVARQRAELSALRERLAPLPYPAGGWPTAHLGRGAG